LLLKSDPETAGKIVERLESIRITMETEYTIVERHGSIRNRLIRMNMGTECKYSSMDINDLI